jgi:CRISPR-associated exonuclease Cas4
LEIRHAPRLDGALPLFSDRLGLVGKADTMEFGPYDTPSPVEDRHDSRHKATDVAAVDDIQPAKQAVVPAGAERPRLPAVQR